MEGQFVNLADSLRRQFVYDGWANLEVVAALRSGEADERSLQLIAHIISAERLWLERIRQQPQSLPVWPKADLDQCEAQACEMGRLWREYLELITAGDLSQVITYKNSKGEAWTNTLGDILTHVLLHSAYHRGQIASHARESGQSPAYTDFIHGVRQGFVK
jgi:uncharacterized damage-inducible protein DinB